MTLMIVSLYSLIRRCFGGESLRSFCGSLRGKQMPKSYRIKIFAFGMETAPNSTSEVLVSIDRKVTLGPFMVSNGDIGMLLIQQKMPTILKKESTSFNGSLIR